MDQHNILSNPLFWIVFGIVLSSIEMIIPGIYLLWIGLASIITGIVGVLFIKQNNPELYILLFCFFSIAIVWFTKQYFQKRYKNDNEDDNNINRRADKLVGREFILTEAIINGRGKIKIDDSVWFVYGDTLDKGEKIRITHADGAKIFCEKT